MADEIDVELRGVTKRFDDVVAVDALDLVVYRGEFLSLLGPSGCGKTTTLRLIAGFERPDDGELLIGGEDVSRLPPYRRDVNTVFQSYALFPHLNVVQNVAYGLRQRGLRKGAREAQAREILKLVRLPQVAERKPRQLSGGQQQRVALARALVMKPRVLLLDEPLGALDLKVRKELQLELKLIQREVGITFVYVTHDQEEALALSDRVAVMNEGRIEQLATPREIYDAPSTAFVADFIGDTNFIKQDGATLAVRPERIEISRNGGAAATAVAFRGSRGRGSARADSRPADNRALRGEVVTAMVIGPAVQCLIRTDDGQEVLVRQQRTGKEQVDAPREGERVVLTWADDAALPLSTDPTGGPR
jgi:spermidine/putrescine transport system ATP-binding protein